VHHVAAQADDSLNIYPPQPTAFLSAAQADLPAFLVLRWQAGAPILGESVFDFGRKQRSLRSD
jgi:hypothetical protein